ncbi:MAG TPA: CPBP family intramembrane glutamic endopeptidase [Pyrinomonadaceae bacterium]|nr:CPBP family intramembrane glutamic endopeptidase [Pyrinomonadaceae bacterium]
MRRIFLNDVGRLRSGWRALLFGSAVVVIFILLDTVLRIWYVMLVNFGPSRPYAPFIADLIFRFTALGTALGAGYLCARWLENLPWRSLGLTFHQGWFRDLLIGCAIGFAALVLAVGIAAAAGGLRFSFDGGSGVAMPLLRSFVGTLVLLFVAALAEEALFRGYGLQTLSRAKLAWLGLLLTSVPFGLAHLSNPNVVPVATFANTALAGVWLGVAYLRTRSLWFPLGVHWSWNWALGWLFGLPVSGKSLPNPLVTGHDLGPAWLTGGGYGIEGGVAGTIALVVFTIFVWRTRWLSAMPELKKLTSEENPVVRSPVLSVRPTEDAA